MYEALLWVAFHRYLKSEIIFGEADYRFHHDYQEALPLAEKSKKIQYEWDAAYDDYIEVIEAKLFIALKEGKLKAFGKPVTLDKDGFQVGEDQAFSLWLKYKEVSFVNYSYI